MYWINKKNADPVVDFAAWELKKYLRMMMPKNAAVRVAAAGERNEGFTLGLLSDFGMPLGVEDPFYDDRVYIQTTEKGGVIAGSNPRSVLLAVYRYLKAQGCEWLFPGPDGEKIPTVEALAPVLIDHTASLRFRGQCNEGSENQDIMMASIDFAPKIGMNTYMLEFEPPQTYYDLYYRHQFDRYREEVVTVEQLLQFKRVCEEEIHRRGLIFHDMGHGWTTDPFHIETVDTWGPALHEPDEELKSMLAEIDGERKYFQDRPMLTNICLSNEKARRIMVEYVGDYAERHTETDVLHVWLSDSDNSQCECEACRKMNASDWYMLFLNEVDEELTRRGLPTRVAFITYYDTLCPPEKIALKNPGRFGMLFAPISRSYADSYEVEANPDAVLPYDRNHMQMPWKMADALGYLAAWKKVFPGNCFCYEYHFWRNAYYDLGNRFLARTVYRDVHGQSRHGLGGMIEDGSQRGFFPDGFAYWLFGEASFDTGRSYEELEERYYRAGYGENWKKAKAYLDEVDKLADFNYIAADPKNAIATEKDPYVFDPAALSERYEKLIALSRSFFTEVQKELYSRSRAEFVLWDMLQWHAKYLEAISKAILCRLAGDDQGAEAGFENMRKLMAPLHYVRWALYDLPLHMNAFQGFFKKDFKVRAFIENTAAQKNATNFFDEYYR